MFGIFRDLKVTDEPVACPTTEEMDEMYDFFGMDDNDDVEFTLSEADRTEYVASIVTLVAAARGEEPANVSKPLRAQRSQPWLER